MNRRTSVGWLCALALPGLVVLPVLQGLERAQADSAQAKAAPGTSAPGMPECTVEDAFFADEVWGKVGERTCLKCHNAEGDASASKFLLEDASRSAAVLAKNRAAFEKIAPAGKNGKSRMLTKVTGGLEHGGGQILKPDSTGYRILERYVPRLSGAADPKATDDDPGRSGVPYFQGIQFASPERLLRRVTLSLAGRLPTAAEREAVAKGGLEAIDAAVVAVMKEPAFYDRLKEGFNDIFLTVGYAGNAPDALSYDHFEKTRHWTEKYDLSSVPEKERQKARYALAGNYYKALLREPLELIDYIVRNDRPFTELATADYMMVTPYTARGYGIFEQIKDKFKNPDDPFEYIPAHLPALKGRDGKVQQTGAGIYPHAGILSTFQYLRRYPTTVTNRNRLRARMYYQQFLGVDIMALAPRVTDAAAITKKFPIPTMQAADCVSCHKTIDPVAGLFQDYFNEEGHFGPRKGGWFTDMFGPGREGKDMPSDQKWRALQWLGQETAKDPRFPVAMVEHVYYILVGRRPLLSPQDIDDPLFTAKRRAYQEQRKVIRDVADRFAKEGFNLKVAFRGLIASPFYRVDGLAEAAQSPARRAELDDVGLVRLLTPEQLERKIAAVFGKKWGRLQDSDQKFAILYGGIDSKEVTQRNTEPSGAMGAIQRIMANDVACKNVALDFARKPAERKLFPGIELDVVPGSADAEKKIRAAIIHLHDYVLGRAHAVDHPEVERTYKLFAGIIEDAQKRKGLDTHENYFCKAEGEQRPPDPKHTMRAWRAVVTYLLRQDDFLYE